MHPDYLLRLLRCITHLVSYLLTYFHDEFNLALSTSVSAHKLEDLEAGAEVQQTPL